MNTTCCLSDHVTSSPTDAVATGPDDRGGGSGARPGALGDALLELTTGEQLRRLDGTGLPQPASPPTPDRAAAAYRHLVRALLALNRNRFFEALEQLERLEEIDPAHPALALNMGRALSGLGLLDPAQPLLEQACAQSADHVVAWRRLAWHRLVRGDVLGCREAYGRLAELLPKDPHIAAILSELRLATESFGLPDPELDLDEPLALPGVSGPLEPVDGRYVAPSQSFIWNKGAPSAEEPTAEDRRVSRSTGPCSQPPPPNGQPRDPSVVALQEQLAETKQELANALARIATLRSLTLGLLTSDGE